MLYLVTFISVIIVISVILPLLLKVAFFTLADRKVMASMHRRLGPNIVGSYGFLQPFADALKLLLKEYILPALANKILFTVGPYITLVFSLLSSAVICYGPGLSIWDFSLGIIYMLATYSLATYGVLLSGWSANSKYAFLGSLRSTAQLISYELVLTSAILLVVLMWGSFNFTTVTESQKSVWSIWPLAPIFYIFFKTCVAETNRAPFDLAEAESELVSGYMTEHAAAIFVSFFLGEYSSITLICIFISILFLGGYLFSISTILSINNHMLNIIYKIHFTLYYYITNLLPNKKIIFDTVKDGLLSSYTLGFKTALLIFAFIWIRASYPRIRFDQLMSYCWTILLPIVIAFIIIIPCTLYGLEIIPTNDILFSGLYITKRLFSSSSYLSMKRTSDNPDNTTSKKVKLEEAQNSPNNGSPSQASPDEASPNNGSPNNGSPNNGSPDNGSPDNGSSDNGSSSNGTIFGSSARSPSMEFTSPGKTTLQPNMPSHASSSKNNEPRSLTSEQDAVINYDGNNKNLLRKSINAIDALATEYAIDAQDLPEAKRYQEALNRGETLKPHETELLETAKEKFFNKSLTDWDKTQPHVYDMQILDSQLQLRKWENLLEKQEDKLESLNDEQTSSEEDENPEASNSPEPNLPEASNSPEPNLPEASNTAEPTLPEASNTAETSGNATSNVQTGSLLDDYADLSTQFGDFFGGDD